MNHEAGQPPRTSPLVRSDPEAVWAASESRDGAPRGYSELMNQLRVLLDHVAAAAPSSIMVREITKLVEEINVRLLPHAVPERNQVSGCLVSIPGRAQLLVPAYSVDELDDRAMAGGVRFRRHHLGSNNAAHGGAIALLFDDVLGRLARTGSRPRSRTAYIHVDYRSVTPIDEDLQIECWFDREEGRKRFMRGILRAGDRVCAEADGLFIVLRPGQP